MQMTLVGAAYSFIWSDSRAWPYFSAASIANDKAAAASIFKLVFVGESNHACDFDQQSMSARAGSATPIHSTSPQGQTPGLVATHSLSS
jgi:hypothetical protein